MNDYEPIGELLDRVRRRWQAARALGAAVRAGLATAAVLTVWLLVTWWAHRSAPALAAAAVGMLLLAVAAAVWGFAPLRRRASDRQLARFIEERVPELDDRLVTAVDVVTRLDSDSRADLMRSAGLTRSARRPGPAGTDTSGAGPGRPALVGPMLADAAKRAAAIDLDLIVSRATLRRGALRASSVLLLLLVVAFAGRDSARQAVDAASLTMFPSRVRLEVVPGNTRVELGHPLSIEARLRGNRAPIAAQVEIAEGDAWRTADMTPDANGTFRLAMESVSRPFKYRVTAGKLTSATYAVTVARAPRVTRIDLDYSYPPSLGLAPRAEQDGGDIFAPSGTEVRLRIHTDSLTTTGRLALNDGRSVALSSNAPTEMTGILTIVADNSYRLALTGPDGLSNPGDTEYFIRVLEDRPPEVHITRPAGDRAVTRLEEVDIEAQADDDYGIDRLDLVYSVRGGDEKAVALDVPRHARSASARHLLALEDLDVQPGDFVSYYVRARDLTRGKRSNEARSDIFFLDVKPYEQEFSLAQSQSMAGSGFTGAIDELVNAQRQVVVATWKLDRRTETTKGARSESDIQSIGKTEADLKSRVEQTASSFRESTMRDPRRRLGAGTSAAQAGPGEDAMTAASRAMGQAVSALDGLDTTHALPPEMAALNHLLRAQAEIKHRQLTTNPSAAGAAGNANPNFDISTLFDRELRRQQQTNYETSKSAEKQQPSSDALDKVRDLARRQDELLKRQQALAREQLSEEERKRRLEQLTREQSELRQRAEDLARESGPGQPSRSGGGSASEKLRDISQEMQQAAGDLRRGAPGSSASRALDKLRELENRLRPGAPDDRQRALGDRQLEARQLADRQRELASELERLPAQGDGTKDAMRRMAGEQERLADRARRLRQALQDHTGDRNDPRERKAPDSAPAAAGSDLQRLAEQMQQSADQMRRAVGADGGTAAAGPHGDPRSQASMQREFARQLDRLADRLNPAAAKDDESRKLSEQLARTQELREKIDQVSRALEAAGRQSGRAGSGSTQKAAGESGRTGEGRQGAGGTDLTRLSEESLRQVRQAKELIDQLSREDPGFSRNGAGFTLEGQGMIGSAPGTEAFKQDFAKWEALKKQASVALERAESTLSKKLQAKEAKTRLAAGVDDPTPAAYQTRVDSYFKALAGKKR